MAADEKQKKDHWSAQAYNSAANFVPKLTKTVITYLDVQPNDRVLDIGCGDGQLTVQIAQSASSGEVLGLDASASFLETAKSQNSAPNCTYKLQDCTHIAGCAAAVDGSWDKVFSNAALHWILRNPHTRVDTLRDMHRALKPGGRLVFEMGGKGNCAEFQTVSIATLVKHGVPIAAAREADPWFFPSVDWMRATLSEIGFDVEVCELEYRPTKLTQDTGDRSGGIEGWTRLMGAQFLEVVEEGKRDAVIRDVCEILETVITREEDGSKWLGYVRLRVIAKKK